MKIIQEENYEYAMRNEVEPYLAAHCRDKFVTGAKEDGQGKTTRAAKLHVKFYETERPKGVVIVSHGFTEGAPKYDEIVYYFLKAGYHVCIPEHTGWAASSKILLCGASTPSTVSEPLHSPGLEKGFRPLMHPASVLLPLPEGPAISTFSPE